MEDVVEAIIQEEIQDEKDSRQNSRQLLNAYSSPILSDDKTNTSNGSDTMPNLQHEQNGGTRGTQGISLTEVSWMDSFLPNSTVSQSKV